MTPVCRVPGVGRTGGGEELDDSRVNYCVYFYG